MCCCRGSIVLQVHHECGASGVVVLKMQRPKIASGLRATRTLSGFGSRPAKIEEQHCILQQKWAQASHGAAHEPLSNYISWRVGKPGMMKLSFFQVTMYGGCALALPALRGMERLKAMGLWLLLANAGIRHNWKSPANIALRTKCVSPKKALKLMSHLQLLGLAYYDQPGQVIGISQILDNQAGYGWLHPLDADVYHEPWRTFSRAGT